ncbi:hypothetical protein GE061_009380 [Apolygus lucorum]|uniref:Uncharacterized protein n=1 Tax=Apolygus lucorum TaxID=248454 RepID=A0A8S9Y0C6_APOLU|nr:hypothetical protein GE061_009380 [Apolygus lucorum]
MKRLAVLLLAFALHEESFGVSTGIDYVLTPDLKTVAENLEAHQVNGVERILGVYHQNEKGHHNSWVIFHRLGRPSYHPELCVASFRDRKVDNSTVDCMKFLIDPVVNLGKKKPAISASRMVDGLVTNQKRTILRGQRSGGGGGGGGAGGGGGGGGGGGYHYCC